jgi:hypothetical protein
MRLFCSSVIVCAFHQLLQADSDEQTDYDGSQMDKEVLPRMDGCVGSVDVKDGHFVFLTGWAHVH